ncbi:hypothetical protein G7B40_035435 [Aetokthonos hydrillicola Thurmond2011]|jgi:hypothetical protein|uniref:Uncharacterized protein n=1 Tax=Aetokthonos hydrillicola Thurmond2011 TaxID=2712845 RepID=A0AAP5IDV2_9CYAN|nr:hypothetical protein [Aetokthonos hydrillicola]MBO3460084.1 hypothetical protein [Aetokthonos hydrillicola CCALA 1050]MBW4589517.1 hypothetical protein [Aetokthonos hydrillicola CCALA 1050]MDR9899813.1 hypothetical protein [Aetokthonos hydrillicola Thurmond2011]
MNEKAYILISATVFASVAILHIARLVNHWTLQIGAVSVPLWGSWLGLVIGVLLSVWAFRLMTQLSGSRV